MQVGIKKEGGGRRRRHFGLIVDHDAWPVEKVYNRGYLYLFVLQEVPKQKLVCPMFSGTPCTSTQLIYSIYKICGR